MIPYTYLIGWSDKNIWYYGVQYGAKSNPENLWSNYFTSSKKVYILREELGEPDVIQVRKTFSDPESARKWETKVIRRIGAVESNKWLNQTDNTGNFFWQGERPEFTEDHRKKLSDSHKGKKLSKEHANKLHEGRRNSTNSEEHQEAIKRANTGRKRSEETKKKLSEAKLRDPDLNDRMSRIRKIGVEKAKSDPRYAEEQRQKQSQRMKVWWEERKRREKEGLVNGD
jgi:hypothetical protein